MKVLGKSLLYVAAILLIPSMSHADILSVTSSNSLATVGTATNAQVDFTNWTAVGGCGGTEPCIVGASLLPVTLTGIGSSALTFNYGTNFDFNDGGLNGDRLILQYQNPPSGFQLDLSITGATFYLFNSANIGIPDYGLPPAGGVSICPTLNTNPGNYCYTLDQYISDSNSTSMDISIPPGTPGSEVDVYVAVEGLNANGGSFTINQDAVSLAPEPSSFVLLGTVLLGGLGTMRRRMSGK